MVRRTASVVVVGLLTALASVAVGSAQGDQIRTETTLGGYSVKMDAAPFKMLVDDPYSSVPHEPGTAIVEADPSYTAARLGTGPASRGTASSLWPGTLFGDGLAQVHDGAPAYPIKADARYPDKPYVATAQDNGTFMKAQALGLDVSATARANPADAPSTVDLGTVSSTSTATVLNGVAIGTSESHVTDVSLLAGIIKIGSVSTTLTVKGDGKKGSSSGTTVVNGLTVNGIGYSVDETGAHAVGPSSQGTPPLPTNAADPAKALGITISGISQDHSENATGSTRAAMGLRITIDTVLMRSVLDKVPSQVYDELYSVFAQAPKDLQGFLFYALAATPKITFILGSGQGSAAATLPLSFSFPPIADTVGGIVGPVDYGTPGTPGTPGSVIPGVSAVQLPTGPGAAPQAIPPAVMPIPSASVSADLFHGLSAALLLLVLGLAASGGWGLLRLQSAAVGGASRARPCTDGTKTALPDLRGDDL